MSNTLDRIMAKVGSVLDDAGIPNAPTPRPFTVQGSEHTRGADCWCDPVPCDLDCPGFVHREYLDESWDSTYYSFLCDVCDSTMEPY